jgi:LacI family transcriptional regulator
MRRQGFEKAFAEVGLTPEPSLIVEIHQPTYDNDDWRDAIIRLLDRPDPPTAIVAFNDEVALQVYAVCRARGLNIPGDLSVTGCDDTLSSQYVDPPLTTVYIPAYKQGQLAMDYLLKRMAQKRPRIPEQTLLDVELVVRASCAPPGI